MRRNAPVRVVHLLSLIVPQNDVVLLLASESRARSGRDLAELGECGPHFAMGDADELPEERHEGEAVLEDLLVTSHDGERQAGGVRTDRELRQTNVGARIEFNVGKRGTAPLTNFCLRSWGGRQSRSGHLKMPNVRRSGVLAHTERSWTWRRGDFVMVHKLRSKCGQEFTSALRRVRA